MMSNRKRSKKEVEFDWESIEKKTKYYGQKKKPLGIFGLH